MKKKVAVAMSGGVDSSLTALLLKEQGYDVFGATILVTADSQPVVDEAAAVAGDLGIEHHIFDMTDIFRKNVIDYFLIEYEQGHTPNPCVECNRHLKFKAFWQEAAALGADLMSTGHYVSCETGDDDIMKLRKGIDEAKDQSYMLWHLDQAILKRCLFPLGKMTKHQVRKLAGEKGLTSAGKKDSQDICFIPDGDYRRFLLERRPDIGTKGRIVGSTGRYFGEHNGLPFYTVGQRKGLGIAYSEPLFVTGLDAGRNEVIVGTAEQVFSSEMEIKDLNFISGKLPVDPFRAEVKIRYSKKAAPADIVYLGDQRAKIIFEVPQRAITLGQSAVIYNGDYLLGGGIIDKVGN